METFWIVGLQTNALRYCPRLNREIWVSVMCKFMDAPLFRHRANRQNHFDFIPLNRINMRRRSEL